MISPPASAILAGYTIISNNSPTCLEISGNGEWLQVEKACRRFVKRGIPGRAVDHVTVVVRNADGTRELRDVGVNGVRYAALPSVCGIPVHRGIQGLWGVRKMYRRYAAQITAHGKKIYLGTHATAREAAIVRDDYVRSHDLRVPLNYPEEVVCEMV